MTFLPELFEIIHHLFELQEKGLATVFINISGHVHCIYVRIYEKSWQECATGQVAAFEESVYIGSDNIQQQINDFKKRIFDYTATLSTPVLETIAAF